MHLTVPPLLIPLALAFLASLAWRALASLVGPVHSKRDVYIGLVVIPLASCAVVFLLLHLAGGPADILVQHFLHGLIWCMQGLVWDLLHPFAYGFSA